MTAEDEHIVAELTEPVRAALEPAVALVEDLLADLTRPDPEEGPRAQRKIGGVALSTPWRPRSPSRCRSCAATCGIRSM